jgi:2,3-bisphosphoglycerate-independent phosphoglycerate mutase
MDILTLQRKRDTYLKGPLVTVVMDGVGLSSYQVDNALHLAKTPILDAIFQQYGVTALTAHGKAVGLPSNGDMGNSEVGHNALGAGRIFEQGASLVQSAIATGQIYEGETWRWLVDGALSKSQTFHWIGLLSDGNVHSHENHLHAMLRQAAQEGVKRGRVHILLDGRDVSETSALMYVDRLEAVLADINGTSDYDFQIASGGGRMTTTMDRYEADWTMVERGWAAHVLGDAPTFMNTREAILSARDQYDGVTDQFLPAFVIADDRGPVGTIKEGDSVCFFNFRGDRGLEITRAFEEEQFTAFDRRFISVRYAGMMQYDGDLKLPNRFLVDPPMIDRSLGAYLAYNGVKQYACSETQKFGHVTYFWNGNRSGYFDESIELYEEIPSDLVPFEQRPWMKAAEITDATLAHLAQGKTKYARINYANGDMVGHTGDLHSTILSLEALDLSLGRLLKGVTKLEGAVFITADHGNSEQMFERDKKTGEVKVDHTGKPKALTSHTLNPVPLTLFDPLKQCPQLISQSSEPIGLANLAATTIELLGLVPPDDYAFSLLGRD